MYITGGGFAWQHSQFLVEIECHRCQLAFEAEAASARIVKGF
jgi:hypothetical protein